MWNVNVFLNVKPTKWNVIRTCAIKKTINNQKTKKWRHYMWKFICKTNLFNDLFVCNVKDPHGYNDNNYGGTKQNDRTISCVY